MLLIYAWIYFDYLTFFSFSSRSFFSSKKNIFFSKDFTENTFVWERRVEINKMDFIARNVYMTLKWTGIFSFIHKRFKLGECILWHFVCFYLFFEVFLNFKSNETFLYIEYTYWKVSFFRLFNEICNKISNFEY